MPLTAKKRKHNQREYMRRQRKGLTGSNTDNYRESVKGLEWWAILDSNPVTFAMSTPNSANVR